MDVMNPETVTRIWPLAKRRSTVDGYLHFRKWTFTEVNLAVFDFLTKKYEERTESHEAQTIECTVDILEQTDSPELWEAFLRSPYTAVESVMRNLDQIDRVQVVTRHPLSQGPASCECGVRKERRHLPVSLREGSGREGHGD